MTLMTEHLAGQTVASDEERSAPDTGSAKVGRGGSAREKQKTRTDKCGRWVGLGEAADRVVGKLE